MVHQFRVGVSLSSHEWYWEQVRKGIQRRAQELHIELVSLDDIIVDLPTYYGEELVGWFTQHPHHDLDALLCLGLSVSSWYRVLDCGFPIVSLTETEISHPLLVAPRGMDDIARAVGNYVAEQLQGKGTVLIVGGLNDSGEAGRSRFLGLHQAFLPYPDIHWKHIPSLWGYEQAYSQVYPALLCAADPLDAIIGLTDPLALAGYDAAQALGLCREHTLVVGFGAEPEALSALAAGTMSATVDLFAPSFGRNALEFAIQVAQQRSLPTSFSYQWRLLTPSQETHAQHEQSPASAALSRRLDYKDIDQVISQLSGMTLDRWQLVYGITTLLRVQYGYDHVQIFRWDASRQLLYLEQREQEPEILLPSTEIPMLAQMVRRRLSMYIADTRQSMPASRWSDLRTRILIPILLGDTLLGLLDIHSYSVRQHQREDLVQLEYFARRLGLILHTADLYQEALQANHLKTRLTQHTDTAFAAPARPMSHQEYTLPALPQPDKTILIVDDDALIRERYCSLIREALPDYQIATASGGAEALSSIERSVPRLIILDLVMPYIDGFAVLDRLRLQPQTSHIPVLIMNELTPTEDDVQRLHHPHTLFIDSDMLSPQEFRDLLLRKLGGTWPVASTSPLITQFVSYVQQHYAEYLSLPAIAEKLYISERHLNRMMQQELDMTPWEYVNRYRVKKAGELLRTTSMSVSEIAKEVGFHDTSYFGRVFRRYTDKSPREYRGKHTSQNH